MAKGYTIDVSCEPEWDSPEGHFDDPECVAHVRAGIRSGNEWAWCCVAVTVECEGIEETDYLGACSYDSERDFRNDSGHFDDMVAECKVRIIERCKAALVALGSDEEGK